MHISPNQFILKKYFPEVESFRDIQENVINNVLLGNSSLCLMPTGGGKSLVYQVAGLRSTKVTLVISPLVALMKQQCERLNQKGIHSICLSGLDTEKFYSLLRDFDFTRDSQFIFTSPEKAAFDGYFEYILCRNKEYISLVVLDEAHCVSQWGHSFRPAYKNFPYFLDNVFGKDGWPTLLCLTATLNPKDKEEICTDFKISTNNVFHSDFLLRKNLKLYFDTQEDEKSKKKRLREILSMYPEDKVIVYTHRKKGEYGTLALAEEYQAEGLSCDYFDADLSNSRKEEVLHNFACGAIKIIFATSAFGMGIDIPDIRVVIHYLLPESIEQYYQEVGRAGRDGVESLGYLLYSETNIRIRKDMIRVSFPNHQEIINTFSQKIAPNDKPIKTISPWINLSEKKAELTIFYYLQKYNILQVVAKGVSNLDCFEVKKGLSIDSFIGYKKASKKGLLLAICGKLNLTLKEVLEQLYKWYSNNQIKLVSAPSKVLFYSHEKTMDNSISTQICQDFEEKKASRLENFEKLVQLIESNQDPALGICEYLGIEYAEID